MRIFIKLLFYTVKNEDIRIYHYEVPFKKKRIQGGRFVQRLEGAISRNGAFHSSFQA